MKKVLLDGYTVEKITLENLHKYEDVFYSNEEYYMITDGHSATKETCAETVEYSLDGYTQDNIGFLLNGDAVACLFVLEGYPKNDVLWLGLFLVHNNYKRQSIGTKCINALIAAVKGTDINRIRLSVQDNNIGGLSFWKKIGFEIIDETEFGEYKNLTMEYSIK